MDEKYKQINKHIIDLKKLIEKIKSYQEFTINDYIIAIFKKYGFKNISVYSFNELNINYVRIDISSINKFDLILCYYYFCNIFNLIGLLKPKLPSYSDIDEIKKNFIQNNTPFLKLIKPYINTDNSVLFFEMIKSIIRDISQQFMQYDFKLPRIEEIVSDLLDMFLSFKEKKIKYLPKLKKLLVNDTIILICPLHAFINNPDPPDVVTIPSTMNFYRLMSSDFGSYSCTNMRFIQPYIVNILDYLIPIKKTKRNIDSFIHGLLLLLTKKIKPTMSLYKNKIKSSKILTNKEISRYIQSSHHIHHFRNSQMITKYYRIDFKRHDNSTLFVVHPNKIINLIDYIKLKKVDNYLYFNTNDIIHLLDKVPNVVFVDLACSIVQPINLPINKQINNATIEKFKINAGIIEGSSITNYVEQYTPSPFSPFSESKYVKSLNSSKKITKSFKNSLKKRFPNKHILNETNDTNHTNRYKTVKHSI
jgi:hypothetical protein